MAADPHQRALDLALTRLRQIHLDFHNSPLIEDIGSDFNPEEFAGMLARANVNWVTLFGKCHHGMSYYPTKVGKMHPGLKFDLLGEQIKACRKKGIVTPVYISARVDNHMGHEHPEWIARKDDGSPMSHPPLEAGWDNICMNNKGYIDYLEAQALEILDMYNPDGFFFDMNYYTPPRGCFCQSCLDRMEQEGFDRTDDARHMDMEKRIVREYTTSIASAIRKAKPEATIFFNSRVSVDCRQEIDVLTHLEIEALPAFSGYYYFPLMSRFARTLPRPVQGMTGRFNKSWADFGGIRTPDQLMFDAGTTLSVGAAVNVGDQLHPRGRLDKVVYGTIGKVFSDVKSKEPWCIGAKGRAEVALLHMPEGACSESETGAARMLLELKHQWNFETVDGDWSGYKVLVIPDAGTCGASGTRKLEAFIKGGGRILLSHHATLDAGKRRFNCPGIGIDYKGECEFTPSYMRLPECIMGDESGTEYVMYRPASCVEPEGETQSFGNIWSSYFNRDYMHFTSHYQSPADKELPYPVLTLSDNVAYISGEIFAAYSEDPYHVYRRIVKRALDMLLPKPLLMADAPETMEISVTSQQSPARDVIHMVNLHAPKRMSDSEFMSASRVWPVRDISVRFRSGIEPRKIYLAPEIRDVEFKYNSGYVCFTVPEVKTHRITVVEY